MATIVTRAGKGSALTWTEGDANITNLNNAKLENVVEDTTPQLGGDLDVNGKNITSASNGNIVISPAGSGNISLTPATGKITLGALDFPTGMGTNGQVLTTNGSSAMSWTTISSGGIGNLVEDTTPQLGGNLDVNGFALTSVSNGHIDFTPNGTGNIRLTPASGKIVLGASDWPNSMGTNGQVLTTNGAGTLTWSTSSGGISDVVSDTTPQLGGSLDVNGNAIVSASNGNIRLEPNGSGNIALTPATGKITLGALDFPTSMGTNGQVLTTNGSSAMSWTTISSGATNLDGLSDVVITAAATNDALIYNGTNWVDTALSGVTVGVASTVTLTADNSTNAVNYPLFVNAATGNLSPRTDTGFNYNPSTGALTALSFLGAHNGSVGSTTPSTGAFTSLSTTGNTGLSGSNAAITISPTGTGTVAISPAGALTINPTAASTINNTSIGVTTAAAGRFTTLTATNAVTLSPVNQTITISPTGTGTLTVNPATAGSIDNVSIGATTASTGRFGAVTLTSTLNAGGGVGTNGQVLQSTGSGVQWATASGGGSNIVIISGGGQLTVPATTDGALSPSWTLNSTGGISGVSATSTNLTLPAGTYILEMPILYISDSSNNAPTLLLKNTTDNSTLATIDNFSTFMARVGGSDRVALWAPKFTFTLASSGSVRFYKSGSYPGFQVFWNEPRGGASVYRFYKTA